MGPRDIVWVSVLKLPSFSHFPFHILRMQSQRGVSFSEFLSPRQDFPLAHQGAGKWKSSLIFFIPFVEIGRPAQSSTISLMIVPTSLRWQLRWLLHWKSPFPQRDHHITWEWDHSQAEPSLATRFIFSLFSIWMFTITESWQKLALCSCSWSQGSTPLVSCLIEGAASSFLTVAFCPPAGIFAFSSHPLNGQFFTLPYSSWFWSILVFSNLVLPLNTL